MTRMIKTILVGIIACSLQACSWVQQDLVEPEIQVVGLKHIAGGNLLDQRFTLQLQLTNPNDLELEVKGIHFQLELAGMELMQGVSNEVPIIKPYSTTQFTVQGSANVVQAVRLLRKMQKKPERRFQYTLKTRIDLVHGWPSTFNLQREGDVGLDDWKKQSIKKP